MAQRRSSVPLALSAVMHFAVLGAATYIEGFASSTPRIRAADRLTYLVFAAPPINLDPPVAPLIVPRSLAERPRIPEPLKELVEPAPPEPVRRIEPEKPPGPKEPAYVREPASKPQPMIRARPAVSVGAFLTGTPTVRNPEPVRQIQTSGFDGTAARAPELKAAAPSVGTFDRPAGTSDPRPGTDRRLIALVAQAGFGSGAPAPSASSARRLVTDAGFGGPAIQGRPGGSASRVAVRDSGFDAHAEAPKPLAPQRIDTPVEIVFKPTPTYTDEARALKIEGDVVLEVEFTASNQVRVLRVIRGLGHGLDETAVHAAEQIRFKPAQTDSRPVNFRTTVHIVFRLT